MSNEGGVKKGVKCRHLLGGLYQVVIASASIVLKEFTKAVRMHINPNPGGQGRIPFSKLHTCIIKMGLR